MKIGQIIMRCEPAEGLIEKPGYAHEWKRRKDGRIPSTCAGGRGEAGLGITPVMLRRCKVVQSVRRGSGKEVGSISPHLLMSSG
jgi:hypothetical protein